MTDIDQPQKHNLTEEERSRGGQATKFNNLSHGKYARKLSQIYICPNCGESVPAGHILEQDALMAKLSTKEGIYGAIKKNLISMEQLCDSQADPKDMFVMTHQLNAQLIKLWERLSDTELKKEGEVSLVDVMKRIQLLGDTPCPTQQITDITSSN